MRTFGLAVLLAASTSISVACSSPGRTAAWEKAAVSDRGKALRHPFTGVALAMECGVPDDVCHIIATHAAEGNLVKRTTEAFIVHHADFMSFEPFKNL